MLCNLFGVFFMDDGLVMMVMMVKIEGMMCGVCIFVIEGGFKDVFGVKYFSILLLLERVVIEYDLVFLVVDVICGIIEDRGFDVEVLESMEK